VNAVGLGYSEIDLAYTAGLAVIPDRVKVACAQIVRNAQSTPALNVRSGRIDRMHLDYFADTLVDQTVRSLLAPYVAQKSGLNMGDPGIHFGVSGNALVRAAEAMLRALGGAEVTFLFPLLQLSRGFQRGARDG